MVEIIGQFILPCEVVSLFIWPIKKKVSNKKQEGVMGRVYSLTDQNSGRASRGQDEASQEPLLDCP